MVDVVIIGAGAAGIAAAHRLKVGGRDALVLEAAPRIGGRAHTLNVGEFPLDLGCSWLHSANRNAWVPIAQRLGFSIDKTPPFWERQSGGQDFSPGEQAEFGAALGAMFERLERAGAIEPDAAASTLLEPGSRWNPLLDAVSTYYNGARWGDISIRDFHAYVDTEVNWRVREGYGALVAAYAQGLSIRCNCVAEGVEWSSAGVRVLTDQGAIEAERAIVCVSSAVLASERLRFTPALPEKVEAASALPLGAVEKIVLHFSEAEMLPVEGHLFGRIDTTDTGSYQTRPFGRPLIEGFIAGPLASGLDDEDEGALAAFAIAEMVGLLGSDVRAKLTPAARSHWLTSPFVGGAYSHARPGYAGARDVLRGPVAERIFFAGEACSAEFFSTAHGAYQSGVAAAEALLALDLGAG